MGFTAYELGVWWVPLAKVDSSWWLAPILVAWFLLAKWLLLTKWILLVGYWLLSGLDVPC